MTPNTNVMFDDASVMWIDTDYIYQNLKMPLSTFQQILFSIPSKHRKMINDINNAPACSFPPNNTVKYMVDIYGAAVLALKVPCAFSDQLLTTFIANNYLCFCNRPRPPLQPQPPFDECLQKQILDTLEKISHQNDLLVNGVSQINLTQSNHFLELSNTLCTIRTQNTQILTTLETAKEAILTKLSALINEIKDLLPDYSNLLEELASKLLNVINSMQQMLKNELNNTNSILNNLTSSITNINTTLNNLLSAIENIDIGGGLSDEDKETLNSIYNTVNEVKSILEGTTKR
ncbi:hypothetical protein [Lonomia obliqua multiple nucleopolyhedrovirus]|uniref:Polyhedral calyx protein n=1 Tax=Lonomia obliqua multiple nucleopolyhedrovirus TaxID=134394 RepID=A0A126FCB3_9ABAC|nr:hypothetical protein [Lonomia obliqua multiple nucleopolyhedrovirus]AKN81028.1 hypothetical protein [Lonomia obliqua multiple nucleopolyhedrovirus]